MNKRIVMLLANPFNPDERVLREATALTDVGYHVTILAWDREGRFPKTETSAGFQVERITLKSGYGVRALLTLPIFNLLLFFRLLRTPVDILHCHDFDTLLPGFMIAKLRRKMIVYDAHEYYPGMIRGIGRNRVIQWLSVGVDWLEGVLVRHVTAVITVVPYLLERYQKFGVKKVVIVWNAKDLHHLTDHSPAVQTLRRQLGIKSSTFVYLYVGLFDRRRAPFLQIKAFRTEPRLTDALFVLMGFARDLTYQELRGAIGDARNVRLLPGVPAPELPPYVALADVLDAVHDPHDDNFRIAFPNKFFEAVAAGKPLVTTTDLAIGTLVAKEQAGLVIAYNQLSAFTAALLRLKDDPAFYRRAATNARRLGETTYCWAIARETLLSLYRGLGN